MSTVDSAPPSRIEPNDGSRALADAIVINSCGGIQDPQHGSDTWGSEAPFVMTERAVRDAIASGATATHATIGHVMGRVSDAEAFEISVREIARSDAEIRRNADRVLKVFSTDDILRAKAEHKVGVIYGTQNLAMLGDDAERVRIFHDLGIRMFQLTYSDKNKLGAGCLVPDAEAGLTDFGREVVAVINEVRGIVDLAHGHSATLHDAIAASSAPVIVSHGGCRVFTDIPNLRTDDDLRAIADHGGYIGILLIPPPLVPGTAVSSRDVVAHIEHAVNVAGEDHVGIGTDMSFTPYDDWDALLEQFIEIVRQRRIDGVSKPDEPDPVAVPYPHDLVGPEQLLRLADALSARGHSAERIRKIFGGNFLRVARDIWGA